MTDLKTLTSLADELLAERAALDELAQQAKDAAERIRVLEEERIPTAMADVGLSTFTTASGYTLTVDRKLRCGNLTKPDGLDWLRANGQAGLIRSEVVVPFGVGMDAIARDLVAELAGREMAARQEAKVLHQSLAATVRTMLEEGRDVPLELLGVHVQPTTKVDAPKKPRAKKD